MCACVCVSCLEIFSFMCVCVCCLTLFPASMCVCMSCVVSSFYLNECLVLPCFQPSENLEKVVSSMCVFVRVLCPTLFPTLFSPFLCVCVLPYFQPSQNLEQNLLPYFQPSKNLLCATMFPKLLPPNPIVTMIPTCKHLLQSSKN
jgi:hypothetical protein